MGSLISPKSLKGFRDSLPETEMVRKEMIRSLEELFELFGFLPIDTPALEYSEVLLGKGGGETDKQVYRFFDKGGRDIALRYDLTVPFARFMAGHRADLYLPFKRYHIAKVWRGENTQRGRYREFMQCDFDTVGIDSPSADFEILLLMAKSMEILGLDKFEIRFSHRGIFNRLLRNLKIEDRGIEILRIVDKLQKLDLDQVRKALSSITGREEINRIVRFITTEKNFDETLNKLIAEVGGADEDTQRLTELKKIIDELDLGSFFTLDPSITRGLDYYTGIVFETFLSNMPQTGSVCSGGRYNNLASLYTRENIPGVGASIGLDRLFEALEELRQIELRKKRIHLMIVCMDEKYLGYYYKIAQIFRDGGIAVDIYPEKKRLSRQFQFAEKKRIPIALICGDDEREKDTVTLKDLKNRISYEDLKVGEAVTKIYDLAEAIS